VRVKAKIRETRTSYEVPARSELPDRLDTVLQVIYLIFPEGATRLQQVCFRPLPITDEWESRNRT